MGIIKDNKKFKRTTTQSTPTNPEGVAKKTNTKDFKIDSTTIKEQQNKS
ncbi:hypothetical protein [Psychroserpens damuponensis]|nr:hypothetical protein [Psychroserpens damuponensis]